MDLARLILENLQKKRLYEESQEDDAAVVKEKVKAAQNGDEEAMEYLIVKYDDLLNKMTKRYFLKSGDNDDLKQMALISFWNAIMSFNMSGDFEAYAAMNIKRGLIDAVRKDTTGKEEFNQQADYLSSIAASDDEGGETTLGDTIPDKSGSPEDAYLDKQEVDSILKFIDSNIRGTEKEVLELSMKGYKNGEIAERLGKSYKSVESALGRAKGKILDYINSKMKEGRSMKDDRTKFTESEEKTLKKVLEAVEKERGFQQFKKVYDKVQKDRKSSR